MMSCFPLVERHPSDGLDV